MGCAIYLKGGEISYKLGSMNLFAKLRVLLKYVANTLSHVSVISFVHEKGYCIQKFKSVDVCLPKDCN